MKRKTMWTAIGAGAAYLLRNKESREKLMGQIRNMAGKYKSRSGTKSSVSQ